MTYTVFGNKGFIGAELVKHLRNTATVITPEREHKPDRSVQLGHVIYAIGLTADFRKFPIETVEAHVSKLIEIINNSTFESFTYLSSTRIYQKSVNGTTDEEGDILTNPNDFSDLYNISKIMGESVCLSYKNPKIKVARLSNVIGCDFSSDNFMTQLIKEAIEHKTITLQTGLDSNKDYIYIDDVVNLLVNLHKGSYPIYNIGSGKNLNTKDIIDELKKHITFELIAGDSLPKYEFPAINVSKIRQEFKYQPTNILDNLKKIINSYTHENNN